MLGICQQGQASRERSQADSNETLRFEGARTEIYKAAGETKLTIHIFEPDGHKPSDKRPAIVFFFGGGWLKGTPRQFEQHCRYLASRGMVAMAADYRVFSRHRATVDQCVEDAKSAIRWVRSNAERLGIDPQRIAAGGGSAGGHIAACAGLVPGFEADGEKANVSSVPDAMVLFNPAILLGLMKGFTNAFPESGREDVKKRLGVAPEKLSPTHFVDKGAPPTLVLHGKEDTTVPYWTAEAFVEAMRKVGNRAELVGYEGQGHSFFNYGRGDNPYFLKTVEEMDKFLVSIGYLKGPSTAQAYFSRNRNAVNVSP